MKIATREGLIEIDRAVLHDLLRLPTDLSITHVSTHLGMLNVVVTGEKVPMHLSGELMPLLTPVYTRFPDGHVVLDEIRGLEP